MKSNYKKIISIFFLTQFALIGYSQNETWNWYLSGNGALNFSSGVPVPMGNNAMNLSWEGCSSISDANGNLLFYTDGNWLYDKVHAVTPNGSNLTGNNSVTQVAVFVPKPGAPTFYYLFIIGGPGGGGSNPPWSLHYNEINTSLNGGNGDITIKNSPIGNSAGNCSEKMAVVKHCNGTDYWLLVHDYTGSSYKAYLITAAGINLTPVVSNVGTPFVNSTTSGADDALGQMKISPNGSKVATIYGSTNNLEILDFNRSTGVVSNPIVMGTANQSAYGVEFSPDNTKVYASNGGVPGYITQWDLCAGSPSAIASSALLIPVSGGGLYSLQLASDGKIYGYKSIATLGVINNPNILGVGSNFSNNGPVLISPPFTGTGIGLPNFISSYFDDPAYNQQAIGTQVNSGNCSCVGIATASICSVFGCAPYTYTWSNGSVTGPTNGLTSSISNLCPGTYTVIISDAACKSDTLNFTITGGLSTFSITPASTPDLCGSNNGTASVSVFGGTAPFTYLWNPSLQTSSAISGLAAGSYSVTITDAIGCTQVSVISIVNSPGPVATASGGATIQVGNSVTLNAGGGTTYAWYPAAGLNDTTLANPVATPSVTTFYCVIAYDSNGCSDTACVTVIVISEPISCTEKDFYLPNAFSPNNDNENDVFHAYINPLCIIEFKLVIYNRWGEIVFETEDVTQSWNGEFRGKLSDPAVYTYCCKALFTSGNEIVKKGNVSLIR